MIISNEKFSLQFPRQLNSISYSHSIKLFSINSFADYHMAKNSMFLFFKLLLYVIFKVCSKIFMQHIWRIFNKNTHTILKLSIIGTWFNKNDSDVDVHKNNKMFSFIIFPNNLWGYRSLQTEYVIFNNAHYIHIHTKYLSVQATFIKDNFK